MYLVCNVLRPTKQILEILKGYIFENLELWMVFGNNVLGLK